MLRSDDVNLLQEQKWMFENDKDDKFLDIDSKRTVESMN